MAFADWLPPNCSHRFYIIGVSSSLGGAAGADFIRDTVDEILALLKLGTHKVVWEKVLDKSAAAHGRRDLAKARFKLVDSARAVVLLFRVHWQSRVFHQFVLQGRAAPRSVFESGSGCT